MVQVVQVGKVVQVEQVEIMEQVGLMVQVEQVEIMEQVG
jgi:hypothetical protein